MNDRQSGGTDFLGRVIWQIWKDGQMYVTEALRKFGIGSGQHPVLMMLFNLGNLSQEEISRRLRIDKAATTKAVAKLLKEGYIERKPDSHDKRMYRVSPSQKAQRIREELYRINEEWERILLHGFGATERKVVREVLLRIRENAGSRAKARAAH